MNMITHPLAWPMSAAGQSRRFLHLRCTSGLPPIADMRADIDLRCEGPQGDVCDRDYSFFAKDFATLRAQAMKSLATGLIVRFFTVTRPMWLEGN